MANQFTKYGNTVVDTLNSSYDYSSVMHYERTAFTSNSLPTIEPLSANVKIGQRYKLSPTDIQDIRIFYNCAATGTTLPTTPTTPSKNSFFLNIFTNMQTNHEKMLRIMITIDQHCAVRYLLFFFVL